MANRLLGLFFIVVACMGLCLHSSHHPSAGRDLPPSVLSFAGETNLVSPPPPDDSSPAQRTSSLFSSHTNPLVLDQGEVLIVYPPARRAFNRFRVVLLSGFPLEVFKPPILSL